MAIGFVEARTLLEPGSSFCWGPALEVSTSPSSLFYMLGNMDDIDASTFFLGLRQAGQGGQKRRQVRCSRALPRPARASAIPPAPRANPAPSFRLAPP